MKRGYCSINFIIGHYERVGYYSRTRILGALVYERVDNRRWILGVRF